MNIKAMLKKAGQKIYDHRDDIEYYLGVGFIGAGTASIISKADQAAEINENLRNELEVIKDNDRLIEEDGPMDFWTPEKRRKEIFRVYKEAGVAYAKTYAVGLGLEAAGITLTSISRATQKSKLAIMTSTAMTLASNFNKYRGNVRKEYGDEVDEKMMYGDVIQRKTYINDDGTVEEKIVYGDVDHEAANTFLLSDSTYYIDHPFDLENYDMLSQNMQWLNQRLQTEGFLFKNDVLREMGLPFTKDGWTAGIKAQNPDGTFNYLTCGVEKDTARARDFKKGVDKDFLLTFNFVPDITDCTYNPYARQDTVDSEERAEQVVKEIYNRN